MSAARTVAVLDRPDIAEVVRARYDGRMETTRQIASELGLGVYAVLDWAREQGLANAEQPDDLTALEIRYGGPTRQCLGCLETLPLVAFGRAGRGHARTCRACSQKSAKAVETLPIVAPPQPLAAAADAPDSDRYDLLQSLMRRLPPDGHWSHEWRRRTWVKAFAALVYELTDAPPEAESTHE